MIIIPAIDILDGKCVRLYKGDYDKVTVYYENPVDAAKMFKNSGAKLLHIVDLDAARGEGKNNREVIKRIVAEVNCEVEVGGGIRTEKDIEELLSIGVKRLILGTILVKDFPQVEAWTKKYGQIFVGGIDALNDDVKISGWEKGSGIKVIELARKLEALQFKAIIYTNIAKDGTLEGPDLVNTKKLAAAVTLPVILSGGVSCSDDLEMVKNVPSIWGAITGKAIYENKFDIVKMIDKYQK